MGLEGATGWSPSTSQRAAHHLGGIRSILIGLPARLCRPGCVLTPTTPAPSPSAMATNSGPCKFGTNPPHATRKTAWGHIPGITTTPMRAVWPDHRYVPGSQTHAQGTRIKLAARLDAGYWYEATKLLLTAAHVASSTSASFTTTSVASRILTNTGRGGRRLDHSTAMNASDDSGRRQENIPVIVTELGLYGQSNAKTSQHWVAGIQLRIQRTPGYSRRDTLRAVASCAGGPPPSCPTCSAKAATTR